MSRITAWLMATVAMMIFLTGYQVTVAGVGGEEQHQAPATSDVQAPVPSGAPDGSAAPTAEATPTTSDDKAGDAGAGTDHPPK